MGGAESSGGRGSGSNGGGRSEGWDSRDEGAGMSGFCYKAGFESGDRAKPYNNNDHFGEAIEIASCQWSGHLKDWADGHRAAYDKNHKGRW